MANELEKLLISIEADTQKMRKAMKDAEAALNGYESAVDKSLAKAENRFKRHGTTIIGQMQQIAAGIFGARAVFGALESGAHVVKLSEQLGLTVEAYDRLRAAATATGVEHTALDAGLKKLATGFAGVQSRSGELYEFLRSQLPTVYNQMAAQKDLGGALGVAAEAIRLLGTEHERALVASKLFGDGAADLTRLLRDGKAGMDAAADSGRAFGVALDELSAKSLRDAKKEIDSLTDSLTTTFQIGLAGAIRGTRGLIDMLRDLPNVAKGFSKFDPMVAQPDFFDDSAATRAADAATYAANALKAAAPAVNTWAATVTSAGKAWETTVTKLSIQPKIPDFTTTIDFSTADKLAALAKKRAEASGESLTAIKLGFDSELEEFRRLLVDKKIEEDQFQAARVALNEIAASQIKAVYDKEREEFKAISEQFGSAITDPIQSAFANLIRGTKVSWREMLIEMAANVTQTFARKSLFEPLAAGLGGATATGLGFGGNSTSGVGDFLSSIIPNLFRAGGGDVRAQVPVMVGERGPERFVPAVPGRIEAAGRSSASGGMSVVNQYTIDARGAEIGVEQRIMSALAAAERARPTPAAALAREQRRFPARRVA